MSAAVRYLLAGYVGAVVATKELERCGALACGCDPNCWCRRPGLSLLKWTLPAPHRQGT